MFSTLVAQRKKYLEKQWSIAFSIPVFNCAEQAVIDAAECKAPQQSMLPAGNYFVRYVGGAWKDSSIAAVAEGGKQWTVSFSLAIGNKAVFTMSQKSVRKYCMDIQNLN